jgi:ribosomal protein S18 acetylase RimI-like enzyme
MRERRRSRASEPSPLIEHNSSAVSRTVHLELDVEILRAGARDLPALATWSGHVADVFRSAIEDDDRILLVALARGRFPIGHAHVDLNGTISHLLVLAGFRGQGLGTALIEESERLIQQAGAGYSTLEVEKVNEAAIRLYKRLGYLTTGESSVRWDDPLPDGTVQPVDHPSWVLSKKL